MRCLESIIRPLALTTIIVCTVILIGTYLVEAIIEEENNGYTQSVCDMAETKALSRHDGSRPESLEVVDSSFGSTITCVLEGITPKQQLVRVTAIQSINSFTVSKEIINGRS